MPKAYVLVNVDAGSDKEVLKVLRALEGVLESHIIFGAADLIVEIDSNDTAVIHDIVYEKIRKIPEVRSTQTLTVVD